MTSIREEADTGTVEELEASIRSYARALGEYLVAELRLFETRTPGAVRTVTAEAIFRLLDYVAAFRGYRYAETAFLTPSEFHPDLEDQGRRAVERMYTKIDEVCRSEEEFRLSKLMHSVALIESTVREHQEPEN